MIDDQATGDLILLVVDKLHGMLTMQVLLALFPDKPQQKISALLTRLVRGGALIAVWQASGRQKVWLTRSAARRFLLPETVDNPLKPSRGWAGPRPKLPVTFAHDQMAGALVVGYGRAYGMEFDSDIGRTRGSAAPDGRAWIREDCGLLIEVERMIGQHPRIWRRDGNLVPTMLRTLRAPPDGESVTWEHLVAAPSRLLTILEGYVLDAARERRDIAPGRGWWSLPIEDITRDPVWHPVTAGEPKTLRGLRWRRDKNYLRAVNREIDRERKEGCTRTV